MSQHQMWFRSTLFDAEAGGPNYAKAPAGRQLADWLRDRLMSEGQAIEAVIPEDWGWCIMVQRKPYRLWIGCGRVEEDPADAERSTGRSPTTEVIWSCYVAAERSILGKLLGGRSPGNADVLYRQVLAIVEKDPANMLVEEP